MAILLALGAMDLVAMAAVTIAITVERLLKASASRSLRDRPADVGAYVSARPV